MSFNKKVTFKIGVEGDAEKKLKAIADKAKDISKAYGKMNTSFSKIGKSFRFEVGLITKAVKTAAIGAVALGGAIGVGLFKAVQAAVDAQETFNKFGVVFQDVGEEAEKTAKNFVKNWGMAESTAKDLLSQTGDMLTGFGLTGESALDLSKKTNELAVDLASFTNIEGGAERASKALTKALLGERESAKELGIAILESDVKAKVKAMRATGEYNDMTERQIRAYATLEIATEQSKNAIGDFARTSEELANKQRTLGERLKGVTEQIGTAFIPVMDNIVTRFLKVTEGVSGWIDSNQELMTQLSVLINERIQEGIDKVKEWYDEIGGSAGLTAKLKELWEKITKDIIPAVKKFAEKVVWVMKKIIEWKDEIVIAYGALLIMRGIIAGAAMLSAISGFVTAVGGATTAVGLLSAAIGFLPAAIAITVALYGVKKVIDALQEINSNIGIVETNIDALNKKAKELENKRQEAKRDDNDELADFYKEQIIAISKNMKSISQTLQPRADGGPVSQGSSYVVGERGPEMFVPNQSGTIVPNGGGGQTFNFDFSGASITNEDELVNKITFQLNRQLELANMGLT